MTVSLAHAQPSVSDVVVPDTLLIENFEQDPTEVMASFPSGADLTWVNFDLDGLPGQCVDGGSTPNGWYWESDLGDFSSPNSCYTSCSYFNDDPESDARCANWLILPPVFIPNSTCFLQWKSLSFLGPAFLDGYQVLVSTTTNDPIEGAFTDTLFSAAEMATCLGNCNTVSLNDYTFSPGYIHANGYTNSAYYFLDGPPGSKFNHGRLEPHNVSLSAYEGQTIYVAFLHDSNNDYLLQLDDILVVDDASSAVHTPGDIRQFSVQPTLVRHSARAQWVLESARRGQVQVHDVSGQVLQTRSFETTSSSQQQIDFESLPAGLYFVTLQTDTGQSATRRVVKVD